MVTEWAISGHGKYQRRVKITFGLVNPAIFIASLRGLRRCALARCRASLPAHGSVCGLPQRHCVCAARWCRTAALFYHHVSPHLLHSYIKLTLYVARRRRRV